MGNNNSNKTGELIRKFRLRINMSQVDLEISIGAAAGSISRFESGKVVPTRQTIDKLANVLKLNPIETVKLHGINTEYFSNLIALSEKLHMVNTRDELLRKCVDDINNFFSYTGIAMYIKEGDLMKLKALSTISHMQKVIDLLPFPYEMIQIDLNDDSNSITKAYKMRRPLITSDLAAMIGKFIPKVIVNKAMQISRVKSMVIYPIMANDEVLGMVVIGSRIETNFEDEKGVLEELFGIVGSALARLKSDS